MTCHGNAALFHGTTPTAAGQIASHGFRALDLDEIVDRYTSRFSLPHDTLLPRDSFVQNRADDDSVYTSTRLLHAAGYALGAGEAERMVLDSAFDALFPEEEWDHRDPRRVSWIQDQMGGPDAVVAVLWLPAESVPGAEWLLSEAAMLRAEGIDAPEHEVKLDRALADSAHITVKHVDFCACRPLSDVRNPPCARYVECPVCRAVRATQSATQDGPEVDADWFTCVGTWRRTSGEIDLGEASLRCPDCS